MPKKLGLDGVAADPLKEIRSVARHPRMSSLQIHAEKRLGPMGPWGCHSHRSPQVAPGRLRSAQVGSGRPKVGPGEHDTNRIGPGFVSN